MILHRLSDDPPIPSSRLVNCLALYRALEYFFFKKKTLKKSLFIVNVSLKNRFNYKFKISYILNDIFI